MILAGSRRVPASRLVSIAVAVCLGMALSCGHDGGEARSFEPLAEDACWQCTQRSCLDRELAYECSAYCTQRLRCLEECPMVRAPVSQQKCLEDPDFLLYPSPACTFAIDPDCAAGCPPDKDDDTFFTCLFLTARADCASKCRY